MQDHLHSEKEYKSSLCQPPILIYAHFLLTNHLCLNTKEVPFFQNLKEISMTVYEFMLNRTIYIYLVQPKQIGYIDAS